MLIAVRLVARELRTHLGQPTTRARLLIEGAKNGISQGDMGEVMARWQAMILRRETSDDSPFSNK